MPSRRVLEMRRKAWSLTKLALRARDRAAAEKIIEDYTWGRISRREAVKRLKKLARDGR